MLAVGKEQVVQAPGAPIGEEVPFVAVEPDPTSHPQVEGQCHRFAGREHQRGGVGSRIERDPVASAAGDRLTRPRGSGVAAHLEQGVHRRLPVALRCGHRAFRPDRPLGEAAMWAPLSHLPAVGTAGHGTVGQPGRTRPVRAPPITGHSGLCRRSERTTVVSSPRPTPWSCCRHPTRRHPIRRRHPLPRASSERCVAP